MNRRRNYFIDKSFQSRFIIKFCLLVMVASALTGASLYYFSQHTTTVAFEHLKVVVKSTADFIMPIMVGTLIIVTLLVAAATIIVTLFTSHRIAGPLYRLKIELDKMKNGDFSCPVRIRTKDQLQHLASNFEEMRLNLKGSVKALKENWHSLSGNLRKLRDAAQDASEKRQIEEGIRRIDAELAKLKIE
jgi:methyl-accepting chemotaxis protein